MEKHLKEVKVKLNYTEIEYEDLFNRFAKLFAKILENELEVLGGRTHTLIVMGAENGIINKLIVRSGLDKKYKIKNVPHYSGSPKYSDLRLILKDIVARL